jgi:hypothetical protein
VAVPDSPGFSPDSPSRILRPGFSGFSGFSCHGEVRLRLAAPFPAGRSRTRPRRQHCARPRQLNLIPLVAVQAYI